MSAKDRVIEDKPISMMFKEEEIVRVVEVLTGSIKQGMDEINASTLMLNPDGELKLMAIEKDIELLKRIGRHCYAIYINKKKRDEDNEVRYV